MSAFGLALIGFGILLGWSGFARVNVFNVLRSFVGAPQSPSNFKSAGAG